jgi:hypothetical protein
MYSRVFRSERSTAEELIAVRKGDTYRPISNGYIVGQTDDQGIANVVGIPGSIFSIQIEGMLFDNRRLWKSIDLDTNDDRAITVRCEKKN